MLRFLSIPLLVFFLSTSWCQHVLQDQHYAPPQAVGSGAFHALFDTAQVLTRADYDSTLATNDVPIVYATRFQNNSGSTFSGTINGELHLIYETDSSGNRIPDFSHAGYLGGGVPLPSDVEVAPVFNFSLGSTSSDLQVLLSHVASQPITTTGFRGIIQFEAGTYNIPDVVTVSSPGIIFRGAGSDHNGTVLLVGDNAFFVNNGGPSQVTSLVDIVNFVPTGSHRLYLADTTLFAVGDLIMVLLYIDNAWKAAAQTTVGESLPASYSVARYITDVTTEYIEVEAPVYYNIFTGAVAKLSDYRLRNIGWANLRVVRPSGNPNLGVFIDAHGGITDVFVKNVVTEYVGTLFQGSGFLSRRFTFEDCVALFNPIVTGYDPDIRQMFRTYQLSQVFIHRCHAVYGRAFFGIQATFTGSAIVVSHCSDLRTWRGYYIFGAWFPGQLIEHVYTEYGVDFGATGYGSRTGVSSLIWNTYAEFDNGNLAWLQCTTPTSAMPNLCIGTTTSISDSWNYVRSKTAVLPSSLYIQQLKERVGCDIIRKIFYPSQLTGQYRHPTALSETQWLISNMNKFETNQTNWNTSVAAEIYYGDPWSGSAQCLDTDYIPVTLTPSPIPITPSPTSTTSFSSLPTTPRASSSSSTTSRTSSSTTASTTSSSTTTSRKTSSTTGSSKGKQTGTTKRRHSSSPSSSSRSMKSDLLVLLFTLLSVLLSLW